MSDAGRTLRELAGLLRAGHPLRAAVAMWPSACPATERDGVTAFARRVALGQDPPDAASVTIDALHVATAFEVHRSTGADLARVLDALARWHDDNMSFARRARASSSGASLSARIVAGLPLAGIPLLPAARAPLFDGAGVACLVAGFVLMLVGLRWMARLVPAAPDRPDASIVVSILTSAALAGGATLHGALDAVAGGALGNAALAKARRRVCLGQSWAASLRRTGDSGLVRLASIIESAQRTGAPADRALADWAEIRRAELASDFEARLGRAPVKMVVPLTTCVLPAFGLVAIVPWLRGLAGA